MSISREKLEKEYLNKKVKITLFDDEKIEGFLYKTGTEYFKNNPNLYIPENRYLCSDYKIKELDTNMWTPHSCLFRVSHIKKIGLIDNISIMN